MEDKEVTRKRVLSMCRQAGRLFKRLSSQLPSRVIELIERFPYSSSLVCAVGMEEYYSWRTSSRAGYFSDSDIINGILCEKIQHGLHELIILASSYYEPLPSIETLYSLYAAELQVCFHIGFSYEYEKVHNTQGVMARALDHIKQWYHPFSFIKPGPEFLRGRLNEVENILCFLQQECVTPHPILKEEINVLSDVLRSNCDDYMGFQDLNFFGQTKMMRVIEDNGITRVKALLRIPDKPYGEYMKRLKLSVFSPSGRPDIIMVQKDGLWGPFVNDKGKQGVYMELLSNPFRYERFSLLRGTDELSFITECPEDLTTSHMLVEQKGHWGILAFSQNVDGELRVTEIVPCLYSSPSIAVSNLKDPNLKTLIERCASFKE